MICYYRNSISYSANRREFEEQSVIKGKLKANGIRPSWSLILGRAFREERKKERKEEKKKKKKRKGMETICV